MPISITGTGTITGVSAGGLPDDCITTAEIAGSAVTPAKLSGAQTGSAPIYGVRAWVNFDGTRNEGDTGASTNGANVKIRGSGNVASVLKNGAGDYTISFTTAMANINYAVFGSCENTTAFNILKTFQNAAGTIVAPTTNAVRIVAGNGTTNQDPTYVSVGIIQ
jgi:hypothetical protein